MVKISFGMIVLNGMPFVKYNLRQLYPFAYEIIVVEGAVENAKEMADNNGHSTDGTLEVLKEFKSEEDPENKLKIITKQGCWSEKDEQSQAYASLATGNFLWQVDVDEFYRKKDLEKIVSILIKNPDVSGIAFNTKTFWGGINYVCESWYLLSGAKEYRRLFAWGPDFKYTTHRPPTVLDDKGVDLSAKNWISGKELEKRNKICMYHLSLVFPDQVKNKCLYYGKELRHGAVDWYQKVFVELKRPYSMHNVFSQPGWLEKYSNPLPEQVQLMFGDLAEGRLKWNCRKSEDLDRLVNSWWYPVGVWYFKILFYLGQKKQKLMERLE